MGVIERRERERGEVRRKILDAARDLFASEGYDRITMRRIAEAIEYSPTTIYNHFEDKDDLILALCHEDFGRLLAVFDTQEPVDDPVERLRRLGHAYASFARQSPNHYRFMFMTKRACHPLDESAPGWQTFARLRSVVAEAVESGRFVKGDVDTLAQVLWASVHGAVALLITYEPEQFPCVPPAPDLVEQTIDNAIRGVLASPQAWPG